MKLLICTQEVDTEDPILGFFVRWIEELAKHCERVEVICLKEGKHDLPGNVLVHSLGKEKSVSRSKYTLNFYKYIFSLNYDAVFIHMNQEYMILGGWFWRLRGKRVILWRNHKMGSWLTKLAVLFSNTVCYTSPDAFVAHYKNAIAMPMGIDTDFFILPDAVAPAPKNSILFLGRLDPVKNVAEFIKALSKMAITFHADLYGSPTQPDSPYAKQIAALAQSFIDKGVLTMHAGVPHERTRELYLSHALYVNLTPSGSFDKTIGEAAATGCMVVCANRAIRKVIPASRIVQEDDADNVASGMRAALDLSAQERATEAYKLRAYVEESHSLKKLIDKLTYELQRG